MYMIDTIGYCSNPHIMCKFKKKILNYSLDKCNFIVSLEDFPIYMRLSDKNFVILHRNSKRVECILGFKHDKDETVQKYS